MTPRRTSIAFAGLLLGAVVGTLATATGCGPNCRRTDRPDEGDFVIVDATLPDLVGGTVTFERPIDGDYLDTTMIIAFEGPDGPTTVRYGFGS